MLKKFLAMSLGVVFLAATITGCSLGTNSETKTTNSESSEKISMINVGFVQCGAEGDWRQAMTSSVNETLTKENGINLIFENVADTVEEDSKLTTEEKVEKQKEILKNFIDQKVDVIVFVPVVEDGFKELLQEAKNKGIPVILADRMVADDSVSNITCWVGSNFLLEGYKAGQWIIEYVKEMSSVSTVKKYNTVVLQGTMGTSAQIGRTQGIEETIGTQNNFNIIFKKTANFNEDEGYKVMKEALAKASATKQHIDLLISENDGMTLGALKALTEAGYDTSKDIIIVSFDGVKSAFSLLAQGELNCIVECNPLNGPKLLETINKVINKDPVEKYVYVKEGLYTKSTAQSFLPGRKY